MAISRLTPREDLVNKSIIDIVEQIAGERGVPMAAVSTAWSLSKGMMPIVGLNSISRIDEVVEAIKLVLTPEEIDRLEGSYVPKAEIAKW